MGLLLSIVLATSTLGYALIVPADGEAYSSFSLLAEDETGDLAAKNYPEELVAGEEQRLAVGIGNEHPEPVSYTVVVELQEVSTDGSSAGVLRTGAARERPVHHRRGPPAAVLPLRGRGARGRERRHGRPAALHLGQRL